MQSDDLIWGVINPVTGFCSYKVKLDSNTMCRNQYNVTGLCRRTYCPLANAQYATVLEKDGECYLYMKTIERAHTPSKLWERVKLSKNYLEALAQIDKELEFWGDSKINTVKMRLTRIRQYLIRMRRLTKIVRKKIVPLKKKEERRDAVREKKALIAAEVDKKIKSELLSRLKRGVYDQLNIHERHFEDILAEKETLMSYEEEHEIDGEDYDESEEDSEEEEDDVNVPREEVTEYIEDIDDLEDYGDFQVIHKQNNDENDEEEEEEINSKKRSAKKSS